MVEGWIKDTAHAFWKRAGHPDCFPRDLESAVAWATPLAILRIPNLWVTDVELYLRRRQLPIAVQMEDRPLHGCICAYADRGVIIVNGTDTSNQLRFTIAHEVAHFLRDYVEPRRRAVEKLGVSVMPVLDGIRMATIAERVDSILTGAPIGIFAHYMHRDDLGETHSETIYSETEADRLALELIAAEDEVHRTLPRRLYSLAFDNRISTVQRLLVRRFGLPRSIASQYAQRLCRLWFGGPSIREWLAIT